MIRHADWIVDVGPGAGEHGGAVLYSGPPRRARARSRHRRRARYLFGEQRRAAPDAAHAARAGCGCAASRATTCTTSTSTFPLGVFTTVTGVSGSGKSSLVSQALVELVAAQLGHEPPRRATTRTTSSSATAATTLGGRIVGGMEAHQAPGARRPEADRPHAALEPRDLHRPVRSRAQAVRRDASRRARRRYDAGRFSFNVAKGRCETCEGEGFVMVELLFLPSVYAPCPTCHGARYNAKTLEIKYRGKNIADVLAMTVDAACEFFADEPQRAPVARRAARGRPRLPAARPAGDRALGRRGAAHQAGDRAAARAARRHALRPRRADHRPAPGGRREADGAARRPGRCRQHGHRRRARHARRRRQRLGHRHRPGRGDEGARWWPPGRRRRWRARRAAERRRTWRASSVRRGPFLKPTAGRAMATVRLLGARPPGEALLETGDTETGRGDLPAPGGNAQERSAHTRYQATKISGALPSAKDSLAGGAIHRAHRWQPRGRRPPATHKTTQTQ